MTDSQPHQTTKSLSKRKKGLLPKDRLGKLHPRWVGSSQPEMVGRRFGHVIVISPRVKRLGEKRWIFLKCKCVDCGKVSWKKKSNLPRKGYGGCNSCSRTKYKYDKPFHNRLAERYDAIYQRCNNPNYPGYEDYGGRGIKCLFRSRSEFAFWVTKHLPHRDYLNITIDRINNDGHYVPGNLRLATQAQQNVNRRNTTHISFRGQIVTLQEFDSPYCGTQTRKFIQKGWNGERIIQHAIEDRELRVHRSGWMKRSKWLDSHGCTTS
jgi:hypothetical protein